MHVAMLFVAIIFVFEISHYAKYQPGIIILGCPVFPSVHSSIYPVRYCYQCFVNSFNIFDRTHREYSLAHTDDLIRFCRSEVKVTPSPAKASMSTLGCRSPSSS